MNIEPYRIRLGTLLGAILLVFVPSVAWSGTTLYTGEIRIRMFGTQIPYGVSLSAPVMMNLPPGDPANLSGSAPAAVKLPGGALQLSTSLREFSVSPYSTFLVRGTDFKATNDAGSFAKGGGPGSTMFAPLSGLLSSQFGVSVSGGGNTFGGTMRLLGQFNWRSFCTPASVFCSYKSTFPLSPIGGLLGGSATAMTWIGGTGFPPTAVTVTVWGFPWTTGTAMAAALSGSPLYSTLTTATGTDLRTPGGMGNLQLVSPFLVRTRYDSPIGPPLEFIFGGMAVADLHFVPEPSAWLLLTAGVGGLVALRRFSRRRA